jgi:hypothetical protein
LASSFFSSGVSGSPNAAFSTMRLHRGLDAALAPRVSVTAALEAGDFSFASDALAGAADRAARVAVSGFGGDAGSSVEDFGVVPAP